jgi:hypothetical protein
MSDPADLDDWVCGESYDHDLETTYEGPDGWLGVCRTCGAELWDDTPMSAVAEETQP